MKQVKRSEIVGFLDTSKASSINSATWKIFGNGVTTASYSYNPNTTSETWIVEDNARNTLDSYALSIDGEQSCLFGDDVYDFISKLYDGIAIRDDRTVLKSLNQSIDIYLPSKKDDRSHLLCPD